MKRTIAHRMTNPVALAVGVHVALGFGLAGLQRTAPEAEDFVVMSIAAASAAPAAAPPPTQPAKRVLPPARRTRFAPITRHAQVVAAALPVEVADDAEQDDVTLPAEVSLGDSIDFEAAIADSKSKGEFGQRTGTGDQRGAGQAKPSLDAMAVAINRLAVLRYNWDHNPAVSKCINNKVSAAHQLVRRATAEFHATTTDARRLRSAADKLRELRVATKDLNRLYQSTRTDCLPR